MLVTNRRVYKDYEILERFEAGISLTGAEASSIKRGRINITKAVVKIKKNEVFLINADIPVFPTSVNYDSKKSRKLLLKKNEIVFLSTKIKQFKLTLVPIKVYTKGGLVKIEIALAKPKRKYEKRQKIRAREIALEAERELKESRSRG